MRVVNVSEYPSKIFYAASTMCYRFMTLHWISCPSIMIVHICLRQISNWESKLINNFANSLTRANIIESTYIVEIIGNNLTSTVSLYNVLNYVLTNKITTTVKNRELIGYIMGCFRYNNFAQPKFCSVFRFVGRHKIKSVMPLYCKKKKL
jgi:hypothetical protein